MSVAGWLAGWQPALFMVVRYLKVLKTIFNFRIVKNSSMAGEKKMGIFSACTMYELCYFNYNSAA